MKRGYRILTLLTALSTTPLFTACAYAQYPYGQRQGGYSTSQPYDIGYREGWEHGRNDARGGHDFDFQHAREYQRADEGYNGRFGNHDAYRYEFRRGYERGYRDAYYDNTGNYGRYGNGRDGNGGYYGNYPQPSYGRYGGPGYGYRSPAAEYGYNEGLQKGRDDAEDHRAYDPLRQKWYREGDRHYDSRYGSRDAWANEYRQAFREGYDRGYRDGRY
jgi:hypothetical protein